MAGLGSPSSCLSPTTSSATTADALLRDARLFNSDLGRHSVKSKFSTKLAGRFYTNGSLERHTCRRSHLVEMQERRRRLEKELRTEERRCDLLTKRLVDNERKRDVVHDLIDKLNQGLIYLQSYIRRRQAMKLFHAMKYRFHMKQTIAQSIQCRYRGRRDRKVAQIRKETLQCRHRNASATAIQASVRRSIQRRRYMNALVERERLKYQCAVAIQATARGRCTQQRYLAERTRRVDAAEDIERVMRGHFARRMAKKLRDELAQRVVEPVEEKPVERVPLHLRRYRTISSIASPTMMKAQTQVVDIRSQDREYEQRGGMRMGNRNNNFSKAAAAAVVQNDSIGYDENDSVNSTLTSRSQSSMDTLTKKRVIQRRATTTKSPSWSSSGREVLSNHRLRAANKGVVATALKRPVVIVRRKYMAVEPSTLVPHSPHQKVRQENKKSTQPLSLKAVTTVSEIEQQQSTIMSSLINVSSGPKEEKSDAKSIFREVLYKVPTPPVAIANLLEPAPTILASSLPSLQPPREEINEVMVILDEARIIVQDVLRKAILRTNQWLVYEDGDECREHEDDLLENRAQMRTY